MWRTTGRGSLLDLPLIAAVPTRALVATLEMISPRTLNCSLAKNFPAQLICLSNSKFLSWLLKDIWKRTVWGELMRHWYAGLTCLSNGHRATAAQESWSRAGPCIQARGGMVHCSHTLWWSTLLGLMFVNGKQGWWRKPNRDAHQAEIY